jgi:hypothetical protein
MAGIPISKLEENTNLSDSSMFAEAESSPASTKKVTFATLFSAIWNKIKGKRVKTYDEIMATTDDEFWASATGIKDGFTQLNKNIANKTSLRGFSSNQKIDFDFRTFGRNIARMRVADTTMFDLVPNNADNSTNNKITNLKVDYSGTPWKLSIDVYIDGRTYTKTINFDA